MEIAGRRMRADPAIATSSIGNPFRFGQLHCMSVTNTSMPGRIPAEGSFQRNLPDLKRHCATWNPGAFSLSSMDDLWGIRPDKLHFQPWMRTCLQCICPRNSNSCRSMPSNSTVLAVKIMRPLLPWGCQWISGRCRRIPGEKGRISRESHVISVEGPNLGIKRLRLLSIMLGAVSSKVAATVPARANNISSLWFRFTGFRLRTIFTIAQDQSCSWASFQFNTFDPVVLAKSW